MAQHTLGGCLGGKGLTLTVTPKTDDRLVSQVIEDTRKFVDDLEDNVPEYVAVEIACRMLDRIAGYSSEGTQLKALCCNVARSFGRTQTY